MAETEKGSRPRIAVLVSGRGSNLQSIIDATEDGRLQATIALVVSNKPHAQGLARAREAGIETAFVNPKDYSGRDAYDHAIADLLKRQDVRLVCLAGFMRVVGARLLDAFPNRILNIHPSLLPSFPGLDAQHQAFDYGVRFAGCTAHLVTAELDGGPIILQSAIAVRDDDTPETLAGRILVEEHKLYPEAIALVLEEGWYLQGRRFVRAPRSDARPARA
jgi:phosphoribosylglycinamide formyltransferase-1